MFGEIKSPLYCWRRLSKGRWDFAFYRLPSDYKIPSPLIRISHNRLYACDTCTIWTATSVSQFAQRRKYASTRRGTYATCINTTTCTGSVTTCPTSIIPRQRVCRACRRKHQTVGQLSIFVLWWCLMELLRSANRETNCSIIIHSLSEARCSTLVHRSDA